MTPPAKRQTRSKEQADVKAPMNCHSPHGELTLEVAVIKQEQNTRQRGSAPEKNVPHGDPTQPQAQTSIQSTPTVHATEQPLSRGQQVHGKNT